MKRPRKLFLILFTALLLLLSVNVFANELPITFDSNGKLNFNFKIDGKTKDELLNEGYDIYLIDNTGNSIEESILSFDTLFDIYNWLNSFKANITIKAFTDYDNDLALDEVIKAEFEIPESFKDFYEFYLDTEEAVTRIEIAGNEAGFLLNLDNSLFYQSGNKIVISKALFKDFTLNKSSANISFIKNDLTLKTFTDFNLDNDYFVKSLSSINISNDNDYLYINSDDEDYLNGISFIQIYGIEYLEGNDYVIKEHLTFGDDPKAYDLNSTLSILGNNKPDYDLPNKYNNSLKIELNNLKTLMDKEYDGYYIDIYNHDFVTCHKLFEIKINKPADNFKPVYIPPRTDVK